MINDIEFLKRFGTYYKAKYVNTISQQDSDVIINSSMCSNIANGPHIDQYSEELKRYSRIEAFNNMLVPRIPIDNDEPIGIIFPQNTVNVVDINTIVDLYHYNRRGRSVGARLNENFSTINNQNNNQYSSVLKKTPENFNILRYTSMLNSTDYDIIETVTSVFDIGGDIVNDDDLQINE